MQDYTLLSINASIFIATCTIWGQILYHYNRKYKKQRNELKDESERLQKEKIQLEESIQRLSIRESKSPDEILLLARSYYIERKWKEAAQYFRIAVQNAKLDWELYSCLGQSCANTRDENFYAEAISAYGSAISLIDLRDRKHLSRLYIYRGSIFKRLGRFEEAVKDVELGLHFAVEDTEKADGLYNLACIYAIQNQKNLFMNIIYQIDPEDENLRRRLLVGLKKYAPDFVQYI